MVGTDVAIIAPTTVRATFDLMAKNQGSSQLTGFGAYYVTLASVTDTSFAVVLSGSFTIDTNGVLTVVEIFLSMFTSNTIAGESKLQISGDGGVTWVDVTNAIGVGADIERTGPGLWISSIQTGTNKFRFRILGRSTTGALSLIQIRSDSFIYIVYNKTII